VAVLARTGSSSNVENLKHFLLECPAYDDLRAVCPAFPADVYTTLVVWRQSWGTLPRLHWLTHCFI
jgi:hypothetical protein